MQKQFQKLGLFVSKNLNDEANAKSEDKRIKYLYKKESASVDGSNGRKIKSANDSESSRRRKQEEKLKSYKKKSKGSLERQKKRDPSETEIFFISPEQIKKHRRKTNQKQEKPPEKEKRRHSAQLTSDEPEFDKRKTQNRHEDILRYIKQQASKSTDYQSLTKKEIFKIINNVQQISKDPATSPSFLKKFFLFDKQAQNKPEFIPINDSKYSKKSHNSSQGSDELIFSRHKAPADQKQDKINDGHRKKHREEPPETRTDKVNESRKKKHREQPLEKHDSQKKQHREHSVDKMHAKESKRHHHRKHHKETGDAECKETKKKNSLLLEAAKFVFEDIQICQKKEVKAEKLPTRNGERGSVKKKSKSRDENIDEVGGTAKKEQLEQKLQNDSRVNPKRHKMCLVNNTFSIVEIPPRDTQHDKLEEKKKLTAFKKYYKYDQDEETEVAAGGTAHTFSDSHKMYQDMSESVEDTPRRHRSARESQLETHPSSVADEKSVKKGSHSSRYSDDAAKIVKKSSKRVDNVEIPKVIQKRKSLPQTSKIPRPNSKIVELARDSSPASRARRRSADLFSSKFSDECVDPPSAPFKKRHSDQMSTRISPRNGNPSRPSSARSSTVKDRPNSAKPNVSAKTRESKTAPKFEQRESKMSKASTLSRQSKMSSGFDRKPEKPDLKKVSVSSEPGSYRNAMKGNKFSNDGASSVWSKSSRNTNKASLSSKSDTRLARSRQVSVERKCKPSDGSPAKTSLSNSTFGDKSMDSSKNTTSFFLTKSYKDDDKLHRWQKRKLYADAVRRNAISKNQKASPVPPQVMEVRYLTVSNIEHITPYTDPSFKEREADSGILETSLETVQPLEGQNTPLEFYKEDLPEPHFQLIEEQKFQEFFESPTCRAFNEILKENSDFLQKDFSFKAEDLAPCLSSDDFSSDDLQSDKPEASWCDFKIPDSSSISDISCRRNSDDANVEPLVLDSQDHILGSRSAPGSEESGYSTVKSAQASRSFFEQPAIQALMQTPIDSHFVDVQIERSSSSGLEIRSIESKSLQTTIDCSQKSVQIKLSREEMVEMIHFRKQEEKVGEAAEETGSTQNEGLEQVQDDNERDVEGTEQETKKDRVVEENETLEVDEFKDLIRDQLESGTNFREPGMEPGQIIIYIKENSTREGVELYEICEIVKQDRTEETSKENKKKTHSTSRYKKFKRKVSFLSCVRCSKK